MSTRLTFSIKESVGGLAKILKVFERHHMSINYIESKPNLTLKEHYDCLIEFIHSNESVKFINSNETLNREPDALLEELRKKCVSLSISTPPRADCLESVILQKNRESVGSKSIIMNGATDFKDTKKFKIKGRCVSWFPLKIKDLDKLTNHILSYGSELDSEHPGFKDEEYRKRRKEIVRIAADYKIGQPIPRINYTHKEIKTWGTIFTELTNLYPSHACEEFNQMFPSLIANCGYRADNIPQLEDVSNFLKDCTGFTMRPIAGLLSNRDFLAGLAFRVFNCTQYIRHHSVPKYTPEPDVCHELLGHVALFADPSFAQMAQEIGLASLGASEEYVEKLAMCYWFTVEFGLCKQRGQVKAYGAGILSSIGELQYALSEKPKIIPFDPCQAADSKPLLISYQPFYFCAESFADAKEKILAYVASIPRHFALRYNPYTQSVKVLDNKESLNALFEDIKWELQALQNALPRITET